MKRFLLPLLLLAALTLAASAKTGWSDNYDKALADAKSSGKLVLLDFTGSDWCPWCIRLDKEVFSTPAFKSYAHDHLVLVEVDFPMSKVLPSKVQRQNEALEQQYRVSGFPTVVVLDREGKVVKRLGYEQGGPEKFIAALKTVEK